MKIVDGNLHRTLGRRWNRGVPTLWKLCFKLFNLCLHWLLFGVCGILIWFGGVYKSALLLLLLLLFEITEGDGSLFMGSEIWGASGTCCGGGVGCTGGFRRDGWYVDVPLLAVISVLTDEYDWSLASVIDCADGWVVRTFSFWETVDVLRWWRCMCEPWVDDEWDVGLSIDVLPVVNAEILLKTSFLITVGDAHGLTDGVLFAEIVLLLQKRKRSNGEFHDY